MKHKLPQKYRLPIKFLLLLKKSLVFFRWVKPGWEFGVGFLDANPD